MATDIYRDKAMAGKLKSKAQAAGIIHTSWILHKVDLMQREVDEIHMLALQVYPQKRMQIST